MEEHISPDAIWVDKLPPFLRSRVKGRYNLQKIISNTMWLSWESVFRMVVGFFLGVWVARYLGPEQWGLLNYARASIILFVPLVTLGLGSIAIRELVKSPEESDTILGTIYILQFVGAIIATVIANVSIFLIWDGDNVAKVMVWILSIGYVFRPFEVAEYWFRSRVQSRYPVIARNAALVIVSVIKIVLLISDAPLIAFAVMVLADVVLSSVGLLLVYRYKGYFVTAWRFSRNMAKSLLREGWPLFLTAISLTIFSQINKVMLGQMIGAQALGLYSAANRLSEIWMFIPVAITLSVAPAIIASKEEGSAVYYGRMQKLFSLMSFFSLSAAILVTIFSDLIILSVFGPEYEQASLVLPIQIWALIFLTWGLAQGPWDVNEGLLKQRLVRTLMGSVTAIILGLVLIPMYSAIGAAIATLTASAVAHFFGNLLFPETRKLFIIELRSLVPIHLLYRS